MRNIVGASVCSVAILLAGCASTTIYPGENGNYSLVTTSGQQSYAQKDAEKKASEYCAKMGKSLAVVSNQTAYHGVDKNEGAVIGLASAILAPGIGNPSKSSQDYEVRMTFKCK